MLKVNTQYAREFAEHGSSFTGEEVRLWVYNMADEIDRSRAEVAQLRALLRNMVELAEFWINREDRRQFSEHEYRTWRALGHDSSAMKAARAALAKEGQ
jgi:hypothetical protein